MSLPLYPEINQVAYDSDVFYEWTGSKWKRLDTLSVRATTKSESFAEYTGGNVTIDTMRNNYHRINLTTGPANITIPQSTPYDTFFVEIVRDTAIDGWDVKGMTYDNVSRSVNDYAFPSGGWYHGMYFSPDGLRLFVVGYKASSLSAAVQYNLSVAWDISTATYIGSFVVNSQEQTPNSIVFRDDTGSSFYIMGYTSETIRQYTTATPWNISGATFTTSSPSLAAITTHPLGMVLKPDGTSAYTLDSNGVLRQYIISTPWAINTLSTSGIRSITLPTPSEGLYASLRFNTDGTKLYALTTFDGANSIVTYELSTPWDISTAVFVSSESSRLGVGNPWDFFFKPDGSKAYIMTSDRIVYQFSTGEYPVISWSSNVYWANGVAPDLDFGDARRIMLEFTPTNGKIVGKVIAKDMRG